MNPSLVGEHKSFAGVQRRYLHTSEVLGCDMHFSLYLPPSVTDSTPVLWWLSGLTCTDENFVQKAGAQRAAAKHGVAIVAPDTSPRGEQIPDDPQASYDFGLGAGFYVDATETPWSNNYQMYSYITQELSDLVFDLMPLNSARQSIFGHSMGGHGALTIALKNSERFSSVSAFAPICSPTTCPWGNKAFAGYLGDDQSAWRAHDACALIEDGAILPPIKVDQGLSDEFLEVQLQPQRLQAVCDAREHAIDLQFHQGYDHSYFFIASFIEKHVQFHAQHLMD